MGKIFSFRSAVIVIIVFVVTVVVVVILSYFNIIPLSKYFPGLINKQAVQTGQVPDSEVYTLPKEPTVRVISDVEGYIIASEGNESLLNAIKEQGVFGKNYSLSFGSTKSTPVSLIILHLSPLNQGLTAINDSKGNPNISTGMILLPGIIDVFVYMSPKILEDPSISAKDKGKYLLNGLLTDLVLLGAYSSNRKVNSDDEEQLKKIMGVLDKTGIPYFQIIESKK